MVLSILVLVLLFELTFFGGAKLNENRKEKQLESREIHHYPREMFLCAKYMYLIIKYSHGYFNFCIIL